MTAANPPDRESTPVRIGSKLSAAFEHIQARIRERAYQIFQSRDAQEGDHEKDWFDAQWQLVAPIELAVKVQKKNLLVEGNLKGFAPKEIEIEVSATTLKVFGSHTESSTAGKGDAVEASAETRHFYQEVPLPCEVDADACEAKIFKNGKLRITLPKQVAA